MIYIKTNIEVFIKNKDNGELEHFTTDVIVKKAKELFGEDSTISEALEFGYFGYPVEDDELKELSKHFPDVEFRVYYQPQDDNLGIYSCKNGDIIDGEVIYKFYDFD